MPHDSIIEIESPQGITIWCTKKFYNPIKISYQALLVQEGGPYDRVSDLNTFWMAQDPTDPYKFFERSDWRSGIFERYYSLRLYYVGFGGNDNTTTRFRKYKGNYDSLQQWSKPEILKEYTDSAHLLIPNIWYNIEMAALDTHVTFSVNGENIVDYEDNETYKDGYFGFRTINNHMLIKNFRAETP